MILCPAFLVIGIILYSQYASGDYVEIGNLPGSQTIHEDTITSVFIYSVTAYPSSAACSITSGNTGSVFQITKADNQHTVSTIASPTFDFGTPSYSLEVTCTDNTATATGIITVTITENSAPVFSNLPGVVTISAKTVQANYVIYTVSYTDADDTPPLAYSNMATTPSSTGIFSIADDQLQVEALLLDHTVSSYVITFDVTDGRVSTNQQITVIIDDLDTVPNFVGSTDVTISLPEMTSGRVQIYAIAASDADGDSIQFQYETVAAANSVFDLLGGEGKIFLQSGNALDYEATTSYVFTVTINDYIFPSPVTFTLTLSVTNINEAPVYTGTPNAVSVAESSAGTAIGTLSALCVDPDGETPTYAILSSTYSSYFAIDANTAAVTFALDWDYDLSTTPDQVNLTVRCSDPAGVSDDATYQITITDINDNDPVCSPAEVNYNLLYNQTVSETIVNIQCTDADSTVNAELDYSVIGLTNAYASTFFNVDAYGNVSIKSAFTMDYNTSFYITMLVQDRGAPIRSVTVTLFVNYTEEPTYYIYTEESPCFFCTTGVVTLVAAPAFVFFMFIMLAIVLCVLKCCYDYERGKIFKVLTKGKQQAARWCDCCRPGRKKKPKLSQKEIEVAEARDKEYMRARNALLGQPDEGTQEPEPLKDNEKTSPSFIPNISSNVERRRRSRVDLPPPVKLATPNEYTEMSVFGRKEASQSSARSIEHEEMTESQKVQWQKFQKMKDTWTGEEAVPPPKKPTKTGNVQSQAASGMVWTFQGRE